LLQLNSINTVDNKQLLKFSLEDGTSYFFEVESPPPPPGSVPMANAGQLVAEASQSLDAALSVVNPVAKKLIRCLRSGLPEEADEIEVKFGLKLSTQAGVVFAAAGAEVNFEVKMKWNKKD
jgi:Trypsin-co-occurring domain 1